MRKGVVTMRAVETPRNARSRRLGLPKHCLDGTDEGDVRMHRATATGNQKKRRKRFSGGVLNGKAVRLVRRLPAIARSLVPRR